MKHYIIVKWNDPGAMKNETAVIQKLFDETLSIPGIHSVKVCASCSDRSNRYDLMIEIVMEESALPAYDESAPHHKWKEQYGPAIAHKAIFDCR